MYDIDAHSRQLLEEGYTILPELLPAEEIARAVEAMDAVYEAEREIAERFGLQTDDLKMCFNAQGKHPYFYGLALRYPEPVEVVRQVLGDDMFAHNVSLRKPMPTGRKDATKLGGYLHADWHHFTVEPFVGGRHYPLAVQSAWAISEFSAATGATYLWPGSHLKNEIPPEQPNELPGGYIRAGAPAGSVVLWDSALWHTSGANSSDAPRYSLIYYFHRWWLKGFNDAYRLMPVQIREQMNEEERCFWGLESKVPPNTHLRGMTPAQLAALTPEEKAVLNIAAF